MANEQDRIVGLGLSFLVGCVVGGVAGLLIAPQSGARTRRQLAYLADDVRERAEEATDDTAAAIQRVVKKGRHFAEEAKEDTAEAIQSVIEKGRSFVNS